MAHARAMLTIEFTLDEVRYRESVDRTMRDDVRPGLADAVNAVAEVVRRRLERATQEVFNSPVPYSASAFRVFDCGPTHCSVRGNLNRFHGVRRRGKDSPLQKNYADFNGLDMPLSCILYHRSALRAKRFRQAGTHVRSVERWERIANLRCLARCWWRPASTQPIGLPVLA